VFLSVNGMAAGVATTAALFLKADPQNYIGYNLPAEGQLFDQAQGGPTFRTYTSGIYNTRFYSNGPEYLSLTFMAPRYSAVDNLVGARSLKVGFYDNARRTMSAPELNPGMDVSGFSKGYNRLSGWFNVLDVDYDMDGEITSLAVDFAEYGENLTKSGPGLYGSFRYNSAIAVNTAVPEPTTQAMYLLGIAGLVVGVRKARAQTMRNT